MYSNIKVYQKYLVTSIIADTQNLFTVDLLNFPVDIEMCL